MMNGTENFTNLELEIIGLKVAIDTLDSMVNRQMLEHVGAQAFFPTEQHQKLFFILLNDFLAKKTDAVLMPGNLSCFENVEKITNHPLLKVDGSTAALKAALDIFSKWLKKEVDLTIWAPSLDMELPLHLSREKIIYFASNMSKHHFGHLTDVVKQINNLLPDQEQPRHNIISALESVYSELNDNILNYHGSTIAEMLNNIRWGIHEYLSPEFHRAYQKTDDIFYKFDIPKDIKTDFARSCYWEIMNSVRSKPYIERFSVAETLKLRY